MEHQAMKGLIIRYMFEQFNHSLYNDQFNNAHPNTDFDERQKALQQLEYDGLIEKHQDVDPGYYYTLTPEGNLAGKVGYEMYLTQKVKTFLEELEKEKQEKEKLKYELGKSKFEYKFRWLTLSIAVAGFLISFAGLLISLYALYKGDS